MATAAKAAIVASSSLEPIAVGARELALHRALARGHAHAEEDTEEDKVLERVRVGWTAEGLSDSVRAGVSLGLVSFSLVHRCETVSRAEEQLL